MIQGPETWEGRVSLPARDGQYPMEEWAMNGGCTWQGALTTASLTCSQTYSTGEDPSGSALTPTSHATSFVLSQADLRTGSRALLIVATIVTAEPTATGASGTSSATVSLDIATAVRIGAVAAMLTVAWVTV